MKNILFLLGLLVCGGFVAMADTPVYLDETKPVEERIDDALNRMTLDEKIAVIHAQSKFSAAGVPRLGFPDLWTDDGPHGVRPDVLWDEWRQAGQTNDSCVAFPALTCLAASFDPSLARIYGESLGEEALYRDKDMILGPGVNIFRTPLNGRNFEYMGEDPYLASRMVVPYIQGVQSKGVSACVKHYCLNNDEEYRHQVNVIVSDRALREIYLPAFEAAVKEGGTWGLMGAYNLYKNEHNCHNEILLNNILKGEWGYDGVVVSDWGGTHDTDQAVKNGLDLEFGTWTDGLTMGKTNAYHSYFLADVYKKAILNGTYTTRELDEKVRRVLRLHFRTTMNRNKGVGFMCNEAHYATARKVAVGGIVLLKNDKNLLPMDVKASKKILVVGENAVKMMTVGGGSSSLKVQREVSPLDGIRNLVASINPNARVEYQRGYVGDVGSEFDGVSSGQDLNELRSPEQLIADAVTAAADADYVIFVGGLNKAPYQDCEGNDRKTYDLPYDQDKVISALAKANSRLVVVSISGNSFAMPWKGEVDAIVQGWFLGSEAGNALADVLTGVANPSGKLPFTWTKTLNDVGAHALNTYPGTWREGKDVIDEEYAEGVFVGYRWADKKKITPEFAFGHGLSYTTFELSSLRASGDLNGENGMMTFTVNVKNTGSREGAEVVQLYVHDDKASVERPYKELKGFAKVRLKPGESKDVEISIDRRALSFWDETTNGWKVEPGKFTILVGNASDNLTLKTNIKIDK
ncbi:MAG: beta-glucosidase [Muribaculaceae bacterium]